MEINGNIMANYVAILFEFEKKIAIILCKTGEEYEDYS